MACDHPLVIKSSLTNRQKRKAMKLSLSFLYVRDIRIIFSSRYGRPDLLSVQQLSGLLLWDSR